MTLAVSIAQGGSNNVTMRNRIINGAMMIDQRNAGASASTGTGFLGYVTVDRWAIGSNENLGTIQQVSDAPANFVNSTKITVTGTTSGAAGNYGTFCQRVEGNNIADLGWGTASAKAVTLSFWVKASIAGTYAGYVYNNGYSYCYPFSYSVSSANTWEYKTVTITAPTTGSFPTNTAYGIEVGFTLYAGSNYRGTANTWNAANYAVAPTGSITYPFSNNGMTIQWTGVQFEAGTTATPFEQRLYGTELALCQRYYITVGGDNTYQNICILQAYSTTNANGGAIPFPVKMRAVPTFTYSALSHFYVQNSSGGGITPTVIAQDGAEGSTMCGGIRAAVASGFTAGSASTFFTANTSARLNFSSEL